MDNPETQINRQHRDAEKWTTQRRREMDNPETQRNGQPRDAEKWTTQRRRQHWPQYTE